MFLTIKKIPKNYWSSKKPLNLKPKSLTIFYLTLGLTIFGLGEGLLIVSFSGASPWSVLAQGISLNVDLSIGVVTFIVSVCTLSLWFFLKQKPGIGTVFNIIIIAAIMMILKTVPMPGFCFKKNHKDNVQTLTIKVTTPIDKSTFNEIP